MQQLFSAQFLDYPLCSKSCLKCWRPQKHLDVVIVLLELKFDEGLKYAYKAIG